MCSDAHSITLSCDMLMIHKYLIRVNVTLYSFQNGLRPHNKAPALLPFYDVTLRPTFYVVNFYRITFVYTTCCTVIKLNTDALT